MGLVVLIMTKAIIELDLDALYMISEALMTKLKEMEYEIDSWYSTDEYLETLRKIQELQK